MRKIALYPKLAIKNLRNNKSTYGPYLLACVVSISVFYVLVAICTNPYLGELPYAAYVEAFTMVGAVIMAIFCAILLFYTNSFLIKRRKKEIGLYSILGMNKGNIGILMFFETLTITVISLGLGIASGALLSKLMQLILLKLMRLDVHITMPVSGTAILISVFFFLVIFMLSLLKNLRQVKINDPVKLISGGREGEKEPRSSIIITVLGVLFVGAGYYMAFTLTGVAEALLGFLGAAFLVIIGTYCLFSSGSIAMLKAMRKNKKYYYSSKHFISISGLIYRMKQNAAGLASICILSCMVLVTISSTVSLYSGAEDSVVNQNPYDYNIRFADRENKENLCAATMEGAEQAASISGAEITNLRYNKGFLIRSVKEGGGYVNAPSSLSIDSTTDIQIMSIDDYNRNENKNVNLAEGEALVFYMGSTNIGDSIEVCGTTYSVQKLDSFGKRKAGQGNFTSDITLFVPDYEAAVAKCVAYSNTQQDNIVLGYENLRLYFDVEGSDEAIQSFENNFMGITSELQAGERLMYTTIQAEMREEWYSLYGGFLFLGAFFGIVFTLSAAMIIYYKQLSEGYDDRDRFIILQKVGLSEDEVRSTINSQVKTVFFLPLAVAVIHIAVATLMVRRVMVAFGIFNAALIAFTTVVVILIYALVYLLIYKRTAKTYYNIVRWER